MNEIELATSKILRKYEEVAEVAWKDYYYALKYGKKAEQVKAKKVREETMAIVVAVDEALYALRAELEKVSA